MKEEEVWCSALQASTEVMWTSVQALILEVSKLPTELLGFLRLPDTGFTILWISQIKLSWTTVQCLRDKLYNRYATETHWVLGFKEPQKVRWQEKKELSKGTLTVFHQKFIKMNFCASCDATKS